jgi:hypothetical protein
MDKHILPVEGEKGEIILYQPDDNICLEVRLDEETVWLTQQQMVALFKTTKQNISLHINNIFKEGELQRTVVVKESLTTTIHGAIKDKLQQKKVYLYNLDVIISVGYRVKSQAGTRFRQWATQVLKQYMLRGYSVNQHLVALQERIDNRFTALETRVEEHHQHIDFLIRREQPTKEQLFSTGCVWDAYTYVSNLVRIATERLILIDPFVDERTLLLLDKRTVGVDCTVYTRYSKQTEIDFEKHNQQCEPIRIIQMPQAVHDRYLIIDNEVWLLGASVKDMGRGLTTVIKLSFTPKEILNRI